ncbi:MAG: flagellar hook-basal body complex protein FliE [Planctomycetota bacterium]|nr:MAG: flagellar hook-basal body complex protein FliE [Planctomycetota bacterium]RKY13104.1 MAG: flagellar hook-basal body complex protein FliE [Planctomycetota bacterium]
MAIQFNPNISNLQQTAALRPTPQTAHQPQGNKVDFGNAIQKSLEKVNDQQGQANQSIVDLMSGKQQDINSVVADVAKADMSFKMLVGVRNKLVEAYKETMRMQI